MFGSRDAVGFTRADGTMVAFNASARRRKKTTRKPSAYNLFVRREIGQFLPKDRDATAKDYSRAMKLVAQLWNRRGKGKAQVSVGQSGWTGDKSKVGGVAWGKAQRKKSATSKRKSSAKKATSTRKSSAKKATSTRKSSAKKATSTRKSSAKKPAARPTRKAAAASSKKGTRRAAPKKGTGTRKRSGKKGTTKRAG